MVRKISAVVIDDDKDTVAVFRDYLKLKQIDVLGIGYNGKEAVELFEKYNPDVVFLDHMMPEYNGLYALNGIRKKDPHANVIIITADNTIDTNSKIHELNPTAIVYKPFNINEIMELVDKLMRNKSIAEGSIQ